MRILLVNTNDNIGGAAVACSRLMNALQAYGVDVKMMVRDRASDNSRICRCSSPWWRRWLDVLTPGGSFAKAAERLMLLPSVGFSWRRVWAIDANIMGTDITRSVEFRDADVVHLHWVNQGMLSMDDISKIMKSGKRVVWTMHDLWCATALCHYAGDCTEFIRDGGCSTCALTVGGCGLPQKAWRAKAEAYAMARDYGTRLTFVTCSEWLGRQARQSALLKDCEVVTVPNPIDTSVFSPMIDDTRGRMCLPTDKRVILFVSQKVTDERKGAPHFIQALKKLAEDDPTITNKTVVAVMGGHSEDVVKAIASDAGGGWKGYALGYISDAREIACAYNAADCFVLPSLADNLPNTVMEAMACGVPCVAFSMGGIPEMIDHRQTGYVAVVRDDADLARGISYCLDECNHERLSQACVEKVRKVYSQEAVAKRFMQLYGR